MTSDDVEDIGPCRVIRTSDKAALVSTDTWEGWIPFSLIDVEDLPDMESGIELECLHVATWFVDREGIE